MCENCAVTLMFLGSEGARLCPEFEAEMSARQEVRQRDERRRVRAAEARRAARKDAERRRPEKGRSSDPWRAPAAPAGRGLQEMLRDAESRPVRPAWRAHEIEERKIAQVPGEPEIMRRQSAEMRRKKRERDAPGSHTAGQKQGRWDYYQGRCWMCGSPAQHMDHVKPLARGGSQWPANLRPVCWPCNKRKAARWPWGPAQYGTGLAVMRLRESAARAGVPGGLPGACRAGYAPGK